MCWLWSQWWVSYCCVQRHLSAKCCTDSAALFVDGRLTAACWWSLGLPSVCMFETVATTRVSFHLAQLHSWPSFVIECWLHEVVRQMTVSCIVIVFFLLFFVVSGFVVDVRLYTVGSVVLSRAFSNCIETTILLDVSGVTYDVWLGHTDNTQPIRSSKIC